MQNEHQSEAHPGLDALDSKPTGNPVEPMPGDEEELIATDSPLIDGVSAQGDSVDSEATGQGAAATEDQSQINAEAPSLPARPPCQTVQQDFEVFGSLDEPMSDSTLLLALPADTLERTTQAIDNLPNVKIDDTANGEEWAGTLRAGQFGEFATASFNGWGENTVEREGSLFRQAVPSEKKMLSAAAPRFSDPGNVLVSGEQAVLRIRALTGLGSIVQIPLWHSGFWITLKAPGDAALLELNRRLTEEKITLGRVTHGLAFANTSVFFAQWLMEFALTYTYETTLKPELAGDIRKHISQLDIPIIAWGLACVIWPRGFPYARAVLEPAGQYKVIKEKINVGKLLWTDTLALSPKQITHMAQRHGSSMTAESLENYRNEFVRGRGRTIKLDDKVEMTLRVPNLDQYLVSGQKWIDNIVIMVDKAFSMANDKTRDQYIMDQGKATNMRQFAHWVESITVDDKLEVRDVETIEQTLDAFSTVDAYRDAYFKEVRSFIEDSTISIVAIPATEKDETSGLPRFPHLLPIDALSVFFTLLVQRAQRIQQRG